MAELFVFFFLNNTTSRENKLWTVKAKSDAAEACTRQARRWWRCPVGVAVGYGRRRPLKGKLTVGRGAVSGSSLLLFRGAYPGQHGKGRMISLRNWTIYKINIKSNIHYAQMTVPERSGGCLFAARQAPVRITGPGLGRSTMQSTRGRAAGWSCWSGGR